MTTVLAILCARKFLAILISDVVMISVSPLIYQHTVTMHLGIRLILTIFLVSGSIRRGIASTAVIDSGCNLSDHRPVVAKFVYAGLHNANCHSNHTRQDATVYTWRWDKTDLNS